MGTGEFDAVGGGEALDELASHPESEGGELIRMIRKSGGGSKLGREVEMYGGSYLGTVGMEGAMEGVSLERKGRERERERERVS